MDIFASRNIDGTIQLDLEFPASSGDGDYIAYYIYRKELIYGTDTTGYLLTSGVLNSAVDETLSYNDTLNIKDGTVYYYTVYRESIAAGKVLYMRDYCMGLEPDISDYLYTLVPGGFSSDLDIVDNTNPRLYTDIMLGLTQGEIDALIRNMPTMLNVWKSDPKIFSKILRTFNWRPSPLLNMQENREQALQLMPYYFPNKGQIDLIETFFSAENKCPVRAWQWHVNQLVDVSQDEPNLGFDETPLGVYSGTPLELTLDFLPVPYMMKVVYREDVTGELIEVTDTPDYDSLGDLMGTGEFIASDGSTVIGTVDYTTGEVSVEPSPDSGSYPVFVQYWFELDLISMGEYLDLATTWTHRETYGDKIPYAINLFDGDKDTSSLGTTIYLYLNLDMGIEAYLYDESGSFSFEDGVDNTFEREYFSNLLFKADRLVPLFGYNKFCLVDRIEIDLSGA